MSYETMANIMYVILSTSWILYIAQELFISGSSVLNLNLSKTEEDRKEIQLTTGLHFNGMEVWLIASLAMTEGTFPPVYSKILTHLYIIMFLLLYSFIIRGVTIPFIYKLKSNKWLKTLIRLWVFSSFAIIFLLGVYISNLFLGYPLGLNGMEEGFISALNIPSIINGLFFLSLAVVMGAAWIKLTTSKELGNRAFKFIKKYFLIYLAPILLLIVYIRHYNEGATVKIIEEQSKSAMIFILPILSIITSIVTVVFAQLEDNKKVLIFGIITVVLFMMTGFIGNYPYLVPSTLNLEYGLTITESVVTFKALNIVFFGVILLLPVVIGYQTWKYRTFSKSK